MPPRRKKPRPYLDTNVILDYVRHRNNDSVVLLDALLHRRIRSYTSYYTILELIDKQQEEKWTRRRLDERETLDNIIRHRFPRELTTDELKAVHNDLAKKFFKPFVESAIMTVLTPTAKTWDAILELLQKWNFSVGDAFHVDAALGSKCNILISNDSPMLRILNESKLIACASPSELEKKLAELGMWSIVSSRRLTH